MPATQQNTLLPTPFCHGSLQRQHTLEFLMYPRFEARVCLHLEANTELFWWFSHLKLSNEKPIVASKPQKLL